MLHPSSNEMILNSDEIKMTSLEYCSELPTNRPHRSGFEGDIFMKTDLWRQTTIVKLYKGQEDKRCFSNQRNIHTKPEITRFLGHLVMSQVKEKLMANTSKFQS